MCLVFCLVMVMHFKLTQLPFSSTCIAWRATKLLCPALMTRVPGNKDHHFLSANRGKQMWIGDYLIPLLVTYRLEAPCWKVIPKASQRCISKQDCEKMTLISQIVSKLNYLVQRFKHTAWDLKLKWTIFLQQVRLSVRVGIHDQLEQSINYR